MLKKHQLVEIRERLQYDLDATEEQAGYDSESFFASRHWSQISNGLQESIKAIEKEMLRPTAKSRKVNRNL